MIRDLFKPRMSEPPLQPAGGEIYAHVFENPRAGIPRNLVWNISVEFEPVPLEGQDWECSFAVEWLTWPIRKWRDLAGLGIEDVLSPQTVEPSLYLMAEHHPATLNDLQFLGLQGRMFEAEILASAEIRADNKRLTVPVSCVCSLRFGGVVVVRDNSEPKPVTVEQAGEAVSQFIELEGLRPPRLEEWRYVLEPDA